MTCIEFELSLFWVLALFRFIEVLCVSSIVSIVSFGLPFMWSKCSTLPVMSALNEHQQELIGNFVSFQCVEGEEYNELASLFFNDGNAAIKLLFHMHQHTFSLGALFIFFSFYITLATITYGIAVPSGLFVPSLLAGAAFGRLFGNLVYKLNPTAYAFSNTYSLIGAASVLGGMARMTISLTVILLEATGNEQFALPLMIALFTARVVGSLFNDDLYHIVSLSCIYIPSRALCPHIPSITRQRYYVRRILEKSYKMLFPPTSGSIFI